MEWGRLHAHSASPGSFIAKLRKHACLVRPASFLKLEHLLKVVAKLVSALGLIRRLDLLTAVSRRLVVEFLEAGQESSSALRIHSQ